MDKSVGAEIAPGSLCSMAARNESACMGKQIYPTDVVIAVQMGCLPSNALQAMPRETVRDMRRRDLSRMIRLDGNAAETIARLKELAASRRAMRLVPEVSDILCKRQVYPTTMRSSNIIIN